MRIFTFLFYAFAVTHGDIFEEWNVQLGACTFTGAYKLENHRIFLDCITECRLTTTCQLVVYKSGVCAFFTQQPDITTFTGRSSCFYVNVSSVVESDLGQCGEVTCPGGYACVQRTNITDCLPVICQEPPSIQHTYISSKSRSIGSKLTYFCNYGYRGQGRRSISCQSDGTWSSTDFTCSSPCDAPLSVENSNVVKTTSIRFELGAVITYECNSGYHSNNVSELQSVCTNESNWSPSVIPCCPTGFTFLSDHCFRLTVDTKLTRLIDMKNECSTIGNHFLFYYKDTTWTRDTLQQVCVNAPNDTYILLGMVKDDIKDDLLQCLDRSEATAERHVEFRYNDIRDRLESLIPDLNISAATIYTTLLTTLENTSHQEFSMHLGIRISDLETRLAYIPNGTDISNTNYTEMLTLLQDTAVNRDRYQSWTYDALVALLRNSTGLVKPSCEAADRWYPGNPNGGDAEQCIVSGPRHVNKFHDVNCVDVNSTIDGRVGFICRTSGKWSIQIDANG